MATETLFGASPTIGSPDNAEDTYSMATRVTFAVDGTISFVRMWGASNAIGTSPSGAVYTTAGVQEVAKALVGYATGAWNTVTFDTPLSVSAGSTHDIVFGPINRYAANTSTLPLTVGNLTGTQGRFISSAVLAFPNTVSAGGAGTTWFGIDVGFDAGVTDVPLTGTAALGALSAVATIVIDKPINGTAALGGLAAAATMTSGPTVTTVGPSGWQSLLDIVREAHSDSVPFLSCPNDGEPLLAAPDGGQYCPFDGWRPR